MSKRGNKSMEPPSKVPRLADKPSTSTNGDKSTNEPERTAICFICGTLTTGKLYSLASCVTNGANKVRLVEVLGRMLGEDLMVIVSYNDYACRGCANILNGYAATMEEANSLKTIILNFIGKKYNVEEDVRGLGAPLSVLYSKITPKESERPVSTYVQKTTTNNTASLVTTSPAVTTTPAAVKTSTTKLKTNTTSVIKTNPVPNVTPSTSKATAASSTTPNQQLLLVPSSKPGGGNKTLVLTKTPTVPGATIVPGKSTSTVKTYAITLSADALKNKSDLVAAQKQITEKIAGGQKNLFMKCSACAFTTNNHDKLYDHLESHKKARAASTTTVTKASTTTKPPTTVTTKTTTTSSNSKVVEPSVSTSDSPPTVTEKVLSFSKF